MDGDPDILSIDLLLSGTDASKEARNDLCSEDWFEGTLKDVSRQVGRKYNRGQDIDDLQQELALKLLEKGHRIKDPRQFVVKKWLKTSGRNKLLNDIRFEKRFVSDEVEPNDETQGEGQASSPTPAAFVSETQFEALFEKEIQDAYFKVTRSSSVERQIFELWRRDYKPLEIAEILHIEPETKIYPLLKAIQKKVVAELNLQPHEKKSNPATDPFLSRRTSPAPSAQPVHSALL